MRSSIFWVATALLVVTGCQTRSRATELRDQARVRRGANWAEQWSAAQERAGLWRYRLELCFSARDGADTSPLTRAEVEAACAADVKTMEGAAERDGQAELLATRWAREQLKDSRLALLFACRASDSLPRDALAQLECADRQLEAKLWSQAKVSLLAAFEQGSPEQQCVVVARIDQHSPSPGRDAASLPLDVVRKCRAAAPVVAAAPPAPSTSPSTPAPAASPAPSVEPAPAPAPERTAPPPSSPPPPAAAPVLRASPDPQPGPGAGLQLNGDLTAGNQGVSVRVGIGFGTSRVAFSVTPSFGFSSLSGSTVAIVAPQPVSDTSFSLGFDARIYFRERRATELALYLRPEAMAGFTSATVGLTGLSRVLGVVGLGAGVGGEYLFSPNVGVTLELGLRGVLTPSIDAVSVGVNGAVGVMLHQ